MTPEPATAKPPGPVSLLGTTILAKVYEAGTVNVRDETSIVSETETATELKLMSLPDVPTAQRKISVFALLRNRARAIVPAVPTVPWLIAAAVAVPVEDAPKAVAARLHVQRVAGALVLNAISPVASPDPPSRRSTMASHAALRAAVVRVTAMLWLLVWNGGEGYWTAKLNVPVLVPDRDYSFDFNLAAVAYLLIRHRTAAHSA
jgi:hypothetical protein